ncbi:MAG TPA: tetratricopeptide repeat protein [Burkholderiales bacterium]|nr:tetratricopeptide repeat protein [Burkholderiales bacterium]
MPAISFDSTTATFEQDVLERSKTVPVLVDFWAPWCAPCRALKPILEKLAVEYDGRFLLAKVNTDENPEIAGAYGVRGIPNVKAFVGGELADEFTGALPESGVRRFLEKLVPSPAEQLRRAAREALAQGDRATAEAQLREALEHDALNDAARIDLAELLVARDDYDGADAALAAMPEERRDERAAALAAKVALWKRGQSLPDLATLKASVDARPEDLGARLGYAERLAAEGQLRPALDELLEVVRRDRGERREHARKTIVTLFGMAGDQPDLVGEYRRRLAGVLY